MVCKKCRKEFTEKYSKWSNGDFCSKFCAKSFVGKQEKGTKIVQCIVCGNDIEVDKRASAKQCKCDDCRKPRYIRKKLKIKIEKTCKVCSKKISRNSKSGLCFKCYKETENNEKYKEYINRWKIGLEDGMKGNQNISNYIRRYLFEKYDSKCCQCGWNKINPKSKRVPLQVEHIDGDYKNNSEENLTLLCPNCHSLTETFMGLNRGNGRKERYKNASVA